MRAVLDINVFNEVGHIDYALARFVYGVRNMLETMKREKKYRKLFFVMETCFSGSVAESCEGIDGVLMMTAANESETSKADMFDNELGVYLSNGFTRAFQTKIIEQPNVILRDLFYYVLNVMHVVFKISTMEN